MLTGNENKKIARRLLGRALVAFCILAATVECIVTMETLETMGEIWRYSGPALSLLWCLGLGLWSLRAIRSHNSKFGMGMVLCLTAILAVGLSSPTGRMIVLAMTGLAMVYDFRVQTSKKSPVR